MRRTWILTILCAAGLAWPLAAVPRGAAPRAGAVQAAAPAPAPGSIAGVWRLNPDLSDKPGQPRSGQGADEGGRGRGGYGGRGGGFGGGGRMGGGFGGGGFGGGGLRRGGGMDPAAMQARMALMREIMQPADQFTLTIGSDRKDVSFAYADGRVFQFKADGSKEKHQLTNGTVDTKTKWDGQTLQTEFDLAGGLEVVRTYALSEKTHQLVVTTRMKGGRMRQGRAMKAVYDPAAQ